jgi:hypothetical protein
MFPVEPDEVEPRQAHDLNQSGVSSEALHPEWNLLVLEHL